jgi:predicted site-specific integrase-resolvase
MMSDEQIKYAQACMYKRQGLSLDKIASLIGYKAKSAVVKLLARGDQARWRKTIENTPPPENETTQPVLQPVQPNPQPSTVSAVQPENIQRTNNTIENVKESGKKVKKCSGRQFAKIVDASYTIIQEYVRDGKITAVDPVTKEIIIDDAIPQFQLWYNEDYRTRQRARKNADQKEQSSPEGEAAPADSTWDGGEIGDNISYKEALRVGEILKARARQLEVDQKSGTLLEKAIVDRQLALAGIEIRKAFERLPMQSIDAILAATTRDQAVYALEDAIRNVLESMDETIDKAIRNLEA